MNTEEQDPAERRHEELMVHLEAVRDVATQRFRGSLALAGLFVLLLLFLFA